MKFKANSSKEKKIWLKACRKPDSMIQIMTLKATTRGTF